MSTPENQNFDNGVVRKSSQVPPNDAESFSNLFIAENGVDSTQQQRRSFSSSTTARLSSTNTSDGDASCFMEGSVNSFTVSVPRFKKSVLEPLISVQRPTFNKSSLPDLGQQRRGPLKPVPLSHKVSGASN